MFRICSHCNTALYFLSFFFSPLRQDLTAYFWLSLNSQRSTCLCWVLGLKVCSITLTFKVCSSILINTYKSTIAPVKVQDIHSLKSLGVKQSRDSYLVKVLRIRDYWVLSPSPASPTPKTREHWGRWGGEVVQARGWGALWSTVLWTRHDHYIKNTEQLREACTKWRHEDRKGLARREGVIGEGGAGDIGGSEECDYITLYIRKKLKVRQPTEPFNALASPVLLPRGAFLHPRAPEVLISFLSYNIYTNLGMPHKENYTVWSFGGMIFYLLFCK